MTPDIIIAAARAWIDTPFRHQGRVRGVGCDCVGLVVGVAAALALPVQDATGYSRHPQGRALRAALDAQLVPLSGGPAPGRVLLFAIEAEACHVGIVAHTAAGDLTLIHAYAQARRVVEHHLDDVWHARVVQSYGFAS